MLNSINNDQESRKQGFIDHKQFEQFTDEEIAQKIVAGSTGLFEVIMRRYNQRLFRIQRSYISEEEAVKDTLQLTYIKVFEHLHTFRGDSRFSTWIIRIAINEALKYLEKQKRYSKLHVFDENKVAMNTNDTPLDHAIREDFRHLLEKTVDSLPSDYRAVYMMREIEHMNIEETSNCLDITPSNVKVKLHRAKLMIREQLERKAVGMELFSFMGDQCDQMVLNVMNRIRQEKQPRL